MNTDRQPMTVEEVRLYMDEGIWPERMAGMALTDRLAEFDLACPAYEAARRPGRKPKAK